MAHLLCEASKNLARFLEKVLPSLFDDWWNEAVVNILSFQQRRRVKERGINSMASLDLAALLRVLDQNWYQVSTKLELTSEARHFVKEMQTVRNRWAHAGSEGFPVDDVYRDLDTLQRFAVVVEAGESLLDEVHETKATLLAKDRPDPGQDRCPGRRRGWNGRRGRRGRVRLHDHQYRQRHPHQRHPHG